MVTYLALLALPYNIIFLYVGTASLGLFLSSTFPSMLAYTEDALQYKGECAGAGVPLAVPRPLPPLSVPLKREDHYPASSQTQGSPDWWEWVRERGCPNPCAPALEHHTCICAFRPQRSSSFPSSVFFFPVVLCAGPQLAPCVTRMRMSSCSSARGKVQPRKGMGPPSSAVLWLLFEP